MPRNECSSFGGCRWKLRCRSPGCEYKITAGTSPVRDRLVLVCRRDWISKEKRDARRNETTTSQQSEKLLPGRGSQRRRGEYRSACRAQTRQQDTSERHEGLSAAAPSPPLRRAETAFAPTSRRCPARLLSNPAGHGPEVRYGSGPGLS